MRRDTTQQWLTWTGREAGSDRTIAATQDVVDGGDAAPSRAGEGGGGGEVVVVVRRDRVSSGRVERLSRHQVIEEIISYNPSATVDFLDSFEDSRLRLYLARLRGSQGARGRHAVWVRPADSPAIVSRERLL